VRKPILQRPREVDGTGRGPAGPSFRDSTCLIPGSACAVTARARDSRAWAGHARRWSGSQPGRSAVHGGAPAAAHRSESGRAFERVARRSVRGESSNDAQLPRETTTRRQARAQGPHRAPGHGPARDTQAPVGTAGRRSRYRKTQVSCKEDSTMHNHARLLIATALPSLLGMTIPLGTASAQVDAAPDRAAADDLFRRGLALMKQGKY